MALEHIPVMHKVRQAGLRTTWLDGNPVIHVLFPAQELGLLLNPTDGFVGHAQVMSSTALNDMVGQQPL